MTDPFLKLPVHAVLHEDNDFTHDRPGTEITVLHEDNDFTCQVDNFFFEDFNDVGGLCSPSCHKIEINHHQRFSNFLVIRHLLFASTIFSSETH